MKADFHYSEGEFEAQPSMVVLRYFSMEPEARVYAARLKAAGIQSYLSNTYAITTLPLPGSGIGLHVCDSDLPEALRLLIHLDKEQSRAVEEQSFHEADHDDIQYQKELHRNGMGVSDKVALSLLACLVALLVLRSFLRASGLVPAWPDVF